MPLFHDLGIATSKASEIGEILWVLWLMLAFFVVPMGLIIATLFVYSKSYRKFHFGITILYSVLNLSHMVADLSVQPIAWYQIALMALLFLIGLILNVVSFQWMRERMDYRLLHKARMIL